jgi:hypothetical protein
MDYAKASWDAQKWNRPSFQEEGNTDRGPWLHSESNQINPNVAERQYGLNAYPGAASNWAKEMYNKDYDDYRFASPKDMRDTMNWARTKDLLYSTTPSWVGYGMYDTLDSPSIMDELYGASEVSEDFIDQHFRSKEEQMEDAGSFESMLMERYARQNPFLIEDEGGWTYRDPMEINYRYGQNLGDQYRYSSDRQPGINNPFIPSDRQPGINNPFIPSDRQPGISDINDPLQYFPSDRQPGIDEFNDPYQYLPSDRQPGIDEFNDKLRMGLTYPEGIGLDRSPEEILPAPEVFEPEVDDPSWWDKILPFLPFSPGGGIGKSIGQGFGGDDMNMAGLTQTWQDILDRTGSEDLANEWLATQQTANIENFDLFHLMSNGYTLEEAQQIISEQGLA